MREMATVRGIELQERDFEVLVGLFECRVMSLAHVSHLYFEGKGESAKKRVQKLKAAGLLRERRRAVGEPSLLHLTTEAFRILKGEGRIERFPSMSERQMERRSRVSEITLRHELDVIDVRVALASAVRHAQGLSLAEFSTWPTLYEFQARHAAEGLGRRELTVKPDAFIRLLEETGDRTHDHMFFLEVDRSSEPQGTVARKAACYMDFYRSGGMGLTAVTAATAVTAVTAVTVSRPFSSG